MTSYNPQIYQALAIARALEFYDRTGTKVNTAYTPKAMLATASRITGRDFHPRGYVEAARALRAFAQEIVNG